MDWLQVISMSIVCLCPIIVILYFCLKEKDDIFFKVTPDGDVKIICTMKDGVLSAIIQRSQSPGSVWIKQETIDDITKDETLMYILVEKERSFCTPLKGKQNYNNFIEKYKKFRYKGNISSFFSMRREFLKKNMED